MKSGYFGKLGEIAEGINAKFDKSEAGKAMRFLALFILLYAVISLSFYALIPLEAVESVTANSVMHFLGWFGYSGEITAGEPVLILLEGRVKIQISELCTGLLEMFVLVASVLASVGISWRKRGWGVLLSVLVVFAFNIIRIVATSLIILGGAEIGVIELAHDLLFRITLFAVIVVTYVAWFYWAVGGRIRFWK